MRTGSIFCPSKTYGRQIFSDTQTFLHGKYFYSSINIFCLGVHHPGELPGGPGGEASPAAGAVEDPSVLPPAGRDPEPLQPGRRLPQPPVGKCSGRKIILIKLFIYTFKSMT